MMASAAIPQGTEAAGLLSGPDEKLIAKIETGKELLICLIAVLLSASEVTTVHTCAAVFFNGHIY